MTPLLYYVAKVFVCSGLLFLYYVLALKNKAFHHWNRFYLLFTVVLSLLLPLIKFTVLSPANESADAFRLLRAVQLADGYMETIVVGNKSQSWSPEQWAACGYALVSLLFFGGLVFSLLRIAAVVKKYGVQMLDKIRFVNTAEPGTPFSFLRYIFWNKDIDLASESGRHIFRHELAHVEEGHTLDKLFTQVVLVLFWCNPFFWLIKKELAFIHEFIADKKAVGQHGTEAFAAAILSAVYPRHFHSLTNPFFQTSIKRRLLMLTKIQNPRRAYLSRVLFLPVLAVVTFAFSVRTKTEGEKNTAALLDAVTQLGGAKQAMLAKSLADTVPQKQIESVDVNKPKDRITVYYTDGSCETMTEQEAMKRGLVNNGGYANAQRGTVQNASAKVDLRLKEPANHPLVVVDGKEIAYELLPAINPNKISLINILKDGNATTKYGEKGKNGVIEIVMKDMPSDQKFWLQADSLRYQMDSLRIISVKGNVRASFNAQGPATINSTEGGEVQDARTLKRVDAPEFQQTATEEPVTVNGTGNQSSPVFSQVEIEASVNTAEWRRHLEKQLLTYIINAAKKGMKPGNYTINVRFLVEKDGSLSDVKALNDPGYGLAEGAVRTVRIGPKWQPGEQGGRKVRSYHTQPITFQIQEQ